MPELLFFWEPTPKEEAARFIADKAPVTRDVFNRLLPELRARAFTIAGIESADVLQAVRDKIAEIPRGASWDAVKKDVLAEISPWLVNEEDPEQRAGDLLAAKRRAELLLRTHGFQAYQAQAWREMDEQRDVFEFWKYQSMEDARVRETHAALDGVILPHDSPFWETHFPPWEFGCRCQVVPMLRDEVEEIQAAEKHMLPEKRNVITGPALKALVEHGTLHRGPSKTLNVTSPAKLDPQNGYSFNPNTLRMPLNMLRERYDAETFATFEQWAKETKFDGEQSVWSWLDEKQSKTGPASVAEMISSSKRVTPEQAAQVLAAEPHTEEAKAMKIWGDDADEFYKLRRGTDEKSLAWQGHVRAILSAVEPVKTDAPLYRGWFFSSAEERDAFAAGAFVDDVFMQQSVGMSGSKSLTIAADPKFLNEHGIIWEIRGSLSARDIEPLMQSLKTDFPHEREVVFSEGGLFVRVQSEWREVESGGKKIRVLYTIIEEVKP